MSDHKVLEGSKIVIIDDSSVILSFFESTLKGFGARVYSFNDPAVAIQEIHGIDPDCILTDYEMPQLTGADVCRYIRKDDMVRNTPIVILSAHDQDEKYINCINAGADDYLLKRTNPEVILSKVKMMIQVKKSRDLVKTMEKNQTYKTTVATLGHEFNNLITVLNGNLIKLKRDTEGNKNLHKTIELILKASNEVVNTISQMGQLTELEEVPYIGEDNIYKISGS
jgi:DNA-binding response OmpR family regulator